MKRIYTLTALLFLMVSSTLVAQPKLKIDKKKYDFGNIVWKTPSTASFSIQNTGNSALVIVNVTSSCGCTIANWTQTPIAPGEAGIVNATYDAKALGHFNKSIGIYTNTSDYPVYLTLLGNVSYKQLDFSKSHPFKIGNLAVNNRNLEFETTQEGVNKTIQLEVVNQSSESYKPVLMHLPPFLQLESDAKTVKSGEKATLTLTLLADKLHHYGLTQTSIYISRFPGDKVGEENEINVAATLVPNFSNLTEQQRKMAPKIDFSTKHISIKGLPTYKKTKFNVNIANQGKSTLKIKEIQLFHPAISVSLSHKEILPGTVAKLKIKVSGKLLKKSKSKVYNRIILVSNDPQNPIASILLDK
ncbi:MAG: DUF1573 domain-containing protein [Bacteroidaceae bacterium]|nr:DUF1573 domain-containing protein [Bacteroidaceae bacterium]